MDPPLQLIQHLRQTLSADELGRAKRFLFERDRRRFIVGRGVLRNILSRYTKENPARLRFRYSKYGKPFLIPPAGQDTLRFNLSHSGELALYAITCRRDIGIDVEQIRSMPDAEQLAERFFSNQENQTFRAVSPEQKDTAFFNCWTRKEAYVKAIGEGLSLPLDQFDVSLAPGEPAALLRARGRPQEPEHWFLEGLEPAPGYVGGLVVEGSVGRLTRWQWSTT